MVVKEKQLSCQVEKFVFDYFLAERASRGCSNSKVKGTAFCLYVFQF